MSIFAPKVHYEFPTKNALASIAYVSGVSQVHVSQSESATVADHSADQYTCTDWPSGWQLDVCSQVYVPPLLTILSRSQT
jgi:hypothetical protein